MVAAELTFESFKQAVPNLAVKAVLASGTAVANNDFVTVDGLSVVQGAIAFAGDGTAGTITITGISNVVVITNAGTLTWNVLAWGY